ncbi:PEP-CTERM sorting domain-containing protein [Thermosulfuriphilus ammonigenes]|uniref:PEP-CTERM sorting domain-containing protein n=1 Tax=Thermosulfuriphilus ammonigenes TaxID=1936021 RepID=A0A6G7PV11_9BACT|nr:PEP-CTERM sorting domain-containing protein [Thermosulfuriphilus ammonigenes]MBA2848490.1 hypothetical protein [Thermosulfuriphilus ammonigenes]QIJ71361.1 PEP-CTERM sorting domain-containing protein [Thermosulfuriphilus ammonigenes]
MSKWILGCRLCFLTLLFCLPVKGYAIPLTANEVKTLKTEINILLQSIIVDTDVWILGTQFFGNIDGNLLYTSQTNNQGWIGVLSGSISGIPININYEGTLSSDPEISLDIDGTVGTDIWKGSAKGMINIGDKDPITQSVAVSINPLKQQLSVQGGVSNIICSWNISAIKDFDGDKKTKEGYFQIDTSIGVVEMPVIPSLAEIGTGFKLYQKSWLYESYIRGRVLIFFEKTKVVNKGNFSNPNNFPVTNKMEVSAEVPEPSTILLLFTGLCTSVVSFKKKE